jgi:hypothetical protein
MSWVMQDGYFLTSVILISFALGYCARWMQELYANRNIRISFDQPAAHDFANELRN